MPCVWFIALIQLLSFIITHVIFKSIVGRGRRRHFYSFSNCFSTSQEGLYINIINNMINSIACMYEMGYRNTCPAYFLCEKNVPFLP